MATLTVYATVGFGSNSGRLESRSDNYDNARAGTSVYISNFNFYVGQRMVSDTSYYVWEGFAEFDTSTIGTGSNVSSVALSAYLLGNNANVSYTEEVRAYDFGTLDTSDFVAGANLGNYTLVASLSATSSLATNQYHQYTNETVFISNINKSGYTRLFHSSSRTRAGTIAYLTSEYLTYDIGTNKPKLVIEYFQPVTGGSEVNVDITAEGSGTKKTESGSEADVDITAEGSGTKKTESGSEVDVDITAEGGAGEKIAYSTSSYGSVSVTAEGGGRGIVIYQFISDPTVKLQQPVATHVKVVSPDYTTGYTAVISPAPSADKAKYRFVEIPEGDSTVCQQVAESLLAKWSVERKNVVGKISLNFALKFEEYVYVVIPQAGIDEELIIQKLVHNISNMTTTMTLGDDVLLNDDELIARIIDELS